jgi:hypothetical protein
LTRTAASGHNPRDFRVVNGGRAMRVWVVVAGVAVVGAAAYFQYRDSPRPIEQPVAPVASAKLEPALPPTAVLPQMPKPPEQPINIPVIPEPSLPPPVTPSIPPITTVPVVHFPEPKPPQLVIPPLDPVVPPPAVPLPALPVAVPAPPQPSLDPIPSPVLPVSGQNASPIPLPNLPVGAGGSPLPRLPGEHVPPATVPPVATVPPTPKFVPLDVVPGGHAAAAVNQSRVRVKYEVTKVGPSGVGSVELWLKDKNGWSRAAGVKSGDALEAELPLDGVYGVKVVPVSGQGVRGPEPDADGGPDLWVIRDTVKPAVSVKVTPAPPKDGKPAAAPFVVEVVVREANLDCQKLEFGWSEVPGGAKPPEGGTLFTGADLTKAKIETKIGVFERRKTGPDEPGVFAAVFDWTPAADVPARVALGVGAVDSAGNKGADKAEFGTDLTQPAAKVVGVQVVPGK